MTKRTRIRARQLDRHGIETGPDDALALAGEFEATPGAAAGAPAAARLVDTAFRGYFALAPPAEFAALTALTHDDFAVVRRKAEILDRLTEPDTLAAMLRDECDAVEAVFGPLEIVDAADSKRHWRLRSDASHSLLYRDRPVHTI